MLVPKEVIRPGTYWYRDEQTGEPRKLTVTPELCRYWHDQGNAMLSAGLTVPVPFEHDFQAHPMTPADKLKANSGWVKKYTLKGDALFSELDITDAEVAKKLPDTIRWTSPWINSFTDGKGKEWRNVISHLALTTRPRIIDQQPFGSVAAALSVATDLGSTIPVPPDARADGAGGFHLSRAGLLTDQGLPAYPIAFSMLAGGIPLTTDAHGHEHDESGRFGKGKGKSRKKSTSHEDANHSTSQADFASVRAGGSGQTEVSAQHLSTKALMAGEKGNHGEAAEHHESAHRLHTMAAEDAAKEGNEEKQGLHLRAARLHKEAGEHRRKLASEHAAFAIGAKSMPKPPPKGKQPPKAEKPESQGGAPDANPSPSEDEDDPNAEMETEIEGEGGGNAPEGVPPEAAPQMPGDVGMEEVLCDLLGALGIHVEHSGDESTFKRSLYNAAMTKMHELAGKGQNAGQQPNRTNPPGQPPNNPKPGGAGQNPLIQQEQQPMFMSLEEIQKLDEPLKSVALSMYDATTKANAKAAEAEKTLNSLRDAKLKEASEARAKRVSLITKFMPKAKADLDAMLAQPAMALSMGEGGAVVDPMAQTLAVLEKGLADLPRMFTADASALSVQPQPTDAGALDDKRVNEIADHMARLMGAPPEAKAS